MVWFGFCRSECRESAIDRSVRRIFCSNTRRTQRTREARGDRAPRRPETRLARRTPTWRKTWACTPPVGSALEEVGEVYEIGFGRQRLVESAHR